MTEMVALRTYIRCAVCGKPVPVEDGTITCSEKCAMTWENNVIRKQVANLRQYGRGSLCCLRKTKTGHPAGVLCGETDASVCRKCGWNPSREAKLIREARKNRKKDTE